MDGSTARRERVQRLRVRSLAAGVMSLPPGDRDRWREIVDSLAGEIAGRGIGAVEQGLCQLASRALRLGWEAAELTMDDLAKERARRTPVTANGASAPPGLCDVHGRPLDEADVPAMEVGFGPPTGGGGVVPPPKIYHRAWERR